MEVVHAGCSPHSPRENEACLLFDCLQKMLESYKELDTVLRDAYVDVLDKGVIPLPDRMPKEQPFCDPSVRGPCVRCASVAQPPI